MARQVYFLNKSFPGDMNIRHALRSFPGIGHFYAGQVCDLLGLGPNLTFDDLSPGLLKHLQKFLQTKYYIQGELDALVRQDIQSFVAIGSVRGIRHNLGLPVRGQRTRTNAQTARKRISLRKGFSSAKAF